MAAVPQEAAAHISPGHALAESVAWLTGAVVTEEDADRRHAMHELLVVVPKQHKTATLHSLLL